MSNMRSHKEPFFSSTMKSPPRACDENSTRQNCQEPYIFISLILQFPQNYTSLFPERIKEQNLWDCPFRANCVCVCTFCHATRTDHERLELQTHRKHILSSQQFAWPLNNAYLYLRIWFCGKVISRMQIFCFSSILGINIAYFIGQETRTRSTHSVKIMQMLHQQHNFPTNTPFCERRVKKTAREREQQRLYWKMFISLKSYPLSPLPHLIRRASPKPNSQHIIFIWIQSL